MLQIGSRALITHVNLPEGRHPKDTDLIATHDEYQAFVRDNKADIIAAYPLNGDHMLIKWVGGGYPTEIEIAWEGSSGADILNLLKAKEHEITTAPLNVLLMLKLSHRYLKDSPHFLKTMADIRLLRGLTCLTPELGVILKKREAETYTYKHPNLSQDKKNFFDASVKYTYDHDDIHRAVAVGPVPAYTKFSVDGAEVKCSRKKFVNLHHTERLQAGLEEAYVLAIERSLVPHPGVLLPREAFMKALMKVCTSITSGWFREYCWEYHDEIAAMYNEDFFDKFKVALAEGKIGPAK